MSEVELKRDIAALQREVANLKSQIGKSPIRIPISNGGDSGEGVRTATVLGGYGENDITSGNGVMVQFTDGAKETAEVYGLGAGGDGTGNQVALADCFPHFREGNLVRIVKIGSTWYFECPFVPMNIAHLHMDNDVRKLRTNLHAC